MPPHTTKNSLQDQTESATPTLEPQEPSLSGHIHKVTEEDHQDNPSDETTPNLAEAIMLMTNKLRRRDTLPKTINTSVKQPDTFDSSDPKKLNNFILLCNLYFRNNSAYSNGGAKICKGDCRAELNRFLAGGPKLIYYNR